MMALDSFPGVLIGESSYGYVYVLYQSGNILRIYYLQDADGRIRDSWGTTAIRITDLTVTPDISRVVAVGMNYRAPTSAGPDDRSGLSASLANASASSINLSRKVDYHMIVYDLASKHAEL